jgi:hypothetical protein
MYNVLPIRKSDKFHLVLGKVTSSGEITEVERVGIAFLKPGSNTFRLKLWTYPEGEFYLARVADSHNAYVALTKEEYSSGGEERVKWQKIGHGEVVGNLIRIRFHLIAADIYLCLFPAKAEPEVANAA